MSRTMVVAVLVMFIAVPCFAQGNYSDSLTITTYYPAPYGVYKNLRLHPSQEPTGNAVQEGVMYYNKSEEVIYYRNSTKWVKLGSGGGGNGGKTCVPYQWTGTQKMLTDTSAVTTVITPHISGSGYLTSIVYGVPVCFDSVVITVDGKNTSMRGLSGIFSNQELPINARFNSDLQVKFQYKGCSGYTVGGAVYYCLEE